MWTRQFWFETLERAIKTFCQGLLGVMGTNQVGVTELDWPQAFSIATTLTIMSVLTSIVSSGVTGQATPSVVGPENHTDAGSR